MTADAVALLDVNMLIALLDPAHVQHDIAHDWFGTRSHDRWATCPITQNGFVRIVSQRAYPNSISTAAAIDLLARFTADDAHQFWPDSISLLDPAVCATGMLHMPAQVTDTYLLALARHHNGILVTLDQALSTSAVERGESHILRIA